MNFSLKKGQVIIIDKDLYYKPKFNILKQFFTKKIKLPIHTIENIIIRKQVNAIFLEIESKSKNLALLFDKKTKEHQVFIDNLKKLNPEIHIIERLSDNQNFCHESCCYYKNE